MRALSIAMTAAALLAAPLAAQTNPHGTEPERCPQTAGIVDYRGAAPRVRKLGEMPRASQIYTVYTVVGRCPQPVVVRRGIGGGPDQPTSPIRLPPRASRAN